MLLRWLFGLALVLLVLLVAAVLLLDTIVKSVLETSIREKTGREVKIGNLNLSVLRSRVTIENFKLYNTAALGGGPFLDMPEIHFELDRAALAQRRLHFNAIRLHLSELNLVASASGRSGPGSMPQFDASILTNQIPRTAGKRDDQLEFAGIDTLKLTLGKIRQTDLKQPANSREFPLGVTNEVITGIRDTRDLQVKLLPLLLRTGGPILIQLFGNLPTLPPPDAAPDILAPIPGAAPKK
ncbi:hypothetical protein LBMAG56_50580 [Verrucomicrobiota bacterium]|nr:hypothetical protein LBMAG56_50580 [Verrucomicrobiota bacterium]